MRLLNACKINARKLKRSDSTRSIGIQAQNFNFKLIIMKQRKGIQTRLEELRTEIRKECISYGEIAELESLVDYIHKDDLELLAWAGVPEF